MPGFSLKLFIARTMLGLGYIYKSDLICAVTHIITAETLSQSKVQNVTELFVKLLNTQEKNTLLLCQCLFLQIK